MAKKNKSRKVKKISKLVEPEPEPEPESESESESEEDTETHQRVTLEEIDAMSDGEEDEIEEWNAEAKALRQAIAEGAFDKLNIGKSEGEVDDDDDDNNEVDDDDNEDEDMEDNNEDGDSSKEDEDENDNKIKKSMGLSGVTTNIKGLKTVTAALVAQKDSLPWPEKMDVIPPTPLPFGQVTEEGIKIQVHDDLKREVAFYDLALQATYAARSQCEELNIPFSRPEDFFAEMVKTDGHMAKVKDRLIFEGKKVDAFEQRKSNREQKLRSKEKHAHRLAEKAKNKKQHLRDVDDWAQSAASNRVGGGRVRDNDDDYLNGMNGGPNKKRMMADKKFGYGGKRGRFKQNDPKSKNDMSDYNPKGNFSGGKKAMGSKRKGKRARDASKGRR